MRVVNRDLNSVPKEGPWKANWESDAVKILPRKREHARFQFERILEEGNCYKRIEKTLAQVSPNASDSLDHLSKRITEIFSSISCSDSQLEFNDTLPSHITRGLVTLSPDRLSQGARGALAICYSYSTRRVIPSILEWICHAG